MDTETAASAQAPPPEAPDAAPAESQTPKPLRLNPVARELVLSVEVEGQAKLAQFAFRPMTHGERCEWRRVSASFRTQDGRLFDEDLSRYAEHMETWTARLLVRVRDLVIGGEPVAWPDDETARLDLLVQLGQPFVAHAYDFVTRHCAGLGLEARGN